MNDPRMPIAEQRINRLDERDVEELGRPVGSATPYVDGGPNPTGGPPVPGIVVVGGLIPVGDEYVGGGFAGGLMLHKKDLKFSHYLDAVLDDGK
ncbi:hypothetical protein LINPERHAP1_LOCUS38470 [Linum perenne]